MFGGRGGARAQLLFQDITRDTEEENLCHCRAYTGTCPRIAGRWRLAGDERNGDGTESRARPTRALPYDDHIRGTVPGLLNDGADRPPDLELGPALAESSLQSVADAG